MALSWQELYAGEMQQTPDFKQRCTACHYNGDELIIIDVSFD
jgi:hypothetical protein